MISRFGTPEFVENILFGKIFSENGMKIKIIGLRSGARVLSTHPFDSSMIKIYLCT